MSIRIQIIVLCILSIFFLYPIIAHVLMYELGYFTDMLPHGKYWVYLQIFLSGPALLIIGLILYNKYGRTTTKIIGLLLIVISVYWLYDVVSQVIKEAA